MSRRVPSSLALVHDLVCDDVPLPSAPPAAPDGAAQALLNIAVIGKKWRRRPVRYAVALGEAIAEWERLGG